MGSGEGRQRAGWYPDLRSFPEVLLSGSRLSHQPQAEVSPSILSEISNPRFRFSPEFSELDVLLDCRREGQDTQEEVQKRNLRDELEERERRHFSSKDKSYSGIVKSSTSLISFRLEISVS